MGYRWTHWKRSVGILGASAWFGLREMPIELPLNRDAVATDPEPPKQASSGSSPSTTVSSAPHGTVYNLTDPSMISVGTVGKFELLDDAFEFNNISTRDQPG